MLKDYMKRGDDENLLSAISLTLGLGQGLRYSQVHMLSLAEYQLRAIEKKDNGAMAEIIRKVMPEFGAKGPGFAIMDSEVDSMYESYTAAKSIYFVVVDKNRVVGGGGIAPLKGSTADVCELKKMYFLPEIRGKGVGTKIVEACLAEAEKFGYGKCYLETLKNMHAANSMYKKFGFKELKKPLGDTGHYGCDIWYEKILKLG